MNLDSRERLIQSSVDFIRCLTDNYGVEAGMRMWATIADTVDPKLKGDIFFAVISGAQSGFVVLSNIKTTDRVAAVKEIRTWSGMGLKEAVDAVKSVESGKITKIEIDPKNHHSAVAGLRRVGFVV